MQTWRLSRRENELVAPPAVNQSVSNPPGSPPINVFLMTHSFDRGGSERQFSVLAQHLGSEKLHLHLGCIRRKGPFAELFGEVPEFRLGGSLYGWTSLRSRLRLGRLFRRQQIQIAHAFDFYTNLTLIPAARLARVPVVIGSQRQLGDLLTPKQFRAQAAAFRWCDAVVCNSQAAADRLSAHGLSPDKLAVIGNALPVEIFAPARPVLPLMADRLRVGMVARMNAAYKKHSGFLRIAARILKQVPGVEFLLAGDGPLRKDLEREAHSLGLDGRVMFLGDCRDVPAVLASMDVAVLTSESESLSNVILEAMAAGLPVVAFRVGGNTELIDDQRGFLISPGDEAAFSAAVVHLLTAPSIRRQMGQNGRTFVEENFSLERVRARYEQLYTSLLSKKGVRIN